MYLYVDTTESINFGVLDTNLNWLEYVEDKSSKVSAEIHAGIYRTLKNLKLNLNDIQGLIYCSGPGSYTGMRVAEGLAQVFQWQKFSLFSFHHFEIPEILGYSEGVWVAKAFKGEVFKYSWGKNMSEKSLVLEKNLDLSHAKTVFSHRKNNYTASISTIELIRNSSKELFKYILTHGLKRDLFYYRELEEEFSRQ